MTATRSASTPPWATSRYTWSTSRSAPNSFRRQSSRRTLRPAVVPEVPGIILLSAVAAIGVLVASLALAMPSRAQSADGAEILLPGPSNRRSQTLRERVNRPFEALADRSSQRRRLNGGLTLSEHLVRANLKLRPSEFVMVQVAFLIAWAVISLLRFGFGPQFVVAGVVGYLVPMRYVRYRQRQRLKLLNRQLPDTLSLLSNALKAGLSLPQALDTVARNTAAPIADELSRVIREMNIGNATDRALAGMVRRTGSEDLYLITPTYFRAMFSDRVGIGLLFVASLSIVIGNFFIRRIVNFRV